LGGGGVEWKGWGHDGVGGEKEGVGRGLGAKGREVKWVRMKRRWVGGGGGKLQERGGGGGMGEWG